MSYSPKTHGCGSGLPNLVKIYYDRELKKYKLATEKFRFLVHLWLQEDCGCKCSECEELLKDAEEILESIHAN